TLSPLGGVWERDGANRYRRYRAFTGTPAIGPRRPGPAGFGASKSRCPAQAALARDLAGVRADVARDVARLEAAVAGPRSQTTREIASPDTRLTREIARTKVDLLKWTLSAPTARTALLLAAMKLP
ncbi:MAG: hypothetical protein ACK54X_13690, partial [Burkholderiales bacterium]